MPKKSKKANIDEHEGRPSGGLTLGDFLVIKKQSTKKTKTSTTEQTQQQTQQQSAAVSTYSEASGEEVSPGEASALSTGEDFLPVINITSEENSNPKYFVCRTKKGGFPIKVENRSSGKKVTLIEHVIGDGKVLVSELKSKFGTGGLFKDGVVELQGDLVNKLSKFFTENKHLLKPYGSTK